MKIIAPARGFQPRPVAGAHATNEMNWSYNYSSSKRDPIDPSGGRMKRVPRRFLLFIFTIVAAAVLSLFTVLGATKQMKLLRLKLQPSITGNACRATDAMAAGAHARAGRLARAI